MRRLFDLFCAGVGLIVLSPVFATIVVAIKIEDGGPVFYKANRAGLNDVIFKLYKFRTMIVDADKLGAGITTATDRRITRVGSFLRRYKLDEFPQLINIIAGDMSLVGPRPEDPQYTKLYSSAQRHIFVVRPGMTSPASLYYKDEASLLTDLDWEQKYITEIMPQKLAIDMAYFNGNSLYNDIGIIFRTVSGIFHLNPRYDR